MNVPSEESLFQATDARASLSGICSSWIWGCRRSLFDEAGSWLFLTLMRVSSNLSRRPVRFSAFVLLAGFCGGSGSALADARGDDLIDRYLRESVRREAILTMNVDYQEPQKEELQLEFTWMRRVRAGLTSHFIRIESPPSEQGKLLLAHEKADGSADYVA